MVTQPSKPKRGFMGWISTALIVVFLLGTGTRIAGASAKKRLMEHYPIPGQMVDAGGFKMHMYCTGKGSPTVILISGLDDFSITWSLVQPDIAKTTRVCSYDRAGLGWSEASPNPRTSGNMVRELHTLLVNAKVEGPYVMVGHSFGGALVQLYAHNYPDEVVGMVLVDSAATNLFIRIPAWKKAIDQKIAFYHALDPLNSFGLLALVPGNIPNRGFPDEALAQYRAISAATKYYETSIAENEMFEKNLAEIQSAHITTLGNIPLVVLSRGYWDPMPGFTEVENQQAEKKWQELQADLTTLSSNGRQIIAKESEHSIQLQQPHLVIDAIQENIREINKKHS
jgi:pimeloyl-ACP methyl ester carboxylesterase